MSDQSTTPLTLLGSNISYFPGVMENYLRLKQIPYRPVLPYCGRP